MTKISQLSDIGANLAGGDEFVIRDVSDATTPNKKVTSSGIIDYVIGTGSVTGFTKISAGAGPLSEVACTFSGSTGKITATSSNFTIDSNGRVGIGTSAPRSPLQVQGGDVVLNADTGTSSATLDVVSNVATNNGQDATPGIAFRAPYDNSSDRPTYAAIWSKKESGGQGQQEGSFVIGTNSGSTVGVTEKLRITSVGRVGLGTSSPSANLHVSSSLASPSGGSVFLVGATPAFGNSTATSYGHVNFGNLDTPGLPSVVSISSSQSGALGRYTDSGNTIGELRFTGTGTDGATGTQAASIIAGTTDSSFGDAVGSTAYLAFTVRGTGAANRVSSPERVLIDHQGRVGIGTNSPSTLLDVNADTVRVRTARTPASASATGAAGEICWDASYIYVCTATNTWKRAALSTW